MAKGDKKSRKTLEPATMDTTIHIHKIIHGISFRKRAPHTIRAIKKIASRMMKTKDVRIEPKLNKFVWSKGIKNLPRRVRVRYSRQRNDDEDAKEKMYTLVQYVPVASFKNLQTEHVIDED
eukprot:Platyproteum_vivax@DN1782_c0_g1_i1.p1